MRTLPLVLAAALVAPTVTRAEEPRGEEPQWSIGAGVSTGTFVVFGSADIGLGTGTGLYSPISRVPAATVTASIERLLGSRTWLVVGFSGAYEHQEYDVPPSATSGSLGDADVSVASLSVGIRQVVTPRAAPVDVSWVLTADGALSRTDATVAVPGAPDGSQKYSDDIAGATFGLAVERALGAGLSVRVATPLVRGAWTRETLRVDYTMPAVDAKGTRFGVGVVLAPRLELRLAF